MLKPEVSFFKFLRPLAQQPWWPCTDLSPTFDNEHAVSKFTWPN